jgi:hypothetical protein
MFFFEIRRSLSGAMDSKLEDLGGPFRDLGGTLDLFSGKGCLNPKRKQQIPPSLGDWLNF